MATNNYKILSKARLADDLFVGDMDEAANTQEQADRDWARSQERDVVGDLHAPPPASRRTSPVAKAATVTLEAQPASEAPDRAPEEPAGQQLVNAAGWHGWTQVSSEPEPEPNAPSHDEIATKEPEAVEPAAPVVVEDSPQRSWAQILADLTQDPRLADVRCLGVCGIDRHSGASDATVAIARWIAQHCDRSALAVEAHFRDPRHAVRFDAREAGLSEALLAERPVADLIQEAPRVENLELLTAGAPLGWFRRGRALSAFPRLFASLRERYETVVVELPAANDRAVKKLPVAALVDAVILVADPKSTSPAKLQRAADRLRAANVPLAATMLSSAQDLSAALRRQRLESTVRGGAAGDFE